MTREEELATARRNTGDALDVSGFDAVRGYIFGDTLAGSMGLPRAGVPNFAGYAIGYRVVRQYLKRTGKSVAETTFLPTREIIEESGFFRQGVPGEFSLACHSSLRSESPRKDWRCLTNGDSSLRSE